MNSISRRLVAASVLSGGSLWAGGAVAQPVCLPIDHIQVDNAILIDAATIHSLVAPFEKRCIGLVEFDEVLEVVTLAYVDRGFILSRAYLPEQDLTTRRLTVKVVEGLLSDIRINDADHSAWIGAVFPGLIGKPANIREVEQGLDQIQSMPRWGAELAFDPGSAPGESILSVTAQTSKPFEFRMGTNNQGNDETGLWNTTLAGDSSNLLGINDIWTWDLSTSLGPNPLSFGQLEDGNNSASFNLTLPYGDWTFSYGYSWSDYQLTIPGAISPIVTDGWSKEHTLEAKYLLSRDQTTKRFLTLELNRSENKNYILDVLIDGSSRVLSDIKLSYAVQMPLWVGAFDGSAYVQQGLQAFGAQDAADQPDGAPDAQFSLIGFSANYSQGLGPEGEFTWASTATGQWSDDLLYGGQGFSIGGVSTVRGSKIALASGSSGMLWRNELEYDVSQTNFGSLAVYGAFDIGRVSAQPNLGIETASAIGGTTGIKLEDPLFSLDLSYQEILSVSEGLQQPEGQFLVSFELIF